MNKKNYFELTEAAKNYESCQWINSKDVLVYAIPTDQGYDLMSMFEAMCFVANNPPASMIALRLPVDVYNLLEDKEFMDDCGIEIKDEYFIDYQGKILI